MSKKSRKTRSLPQAAVAPRSTESSHAFTAEETKRIRAELLNWYDENRRELPWRERATETDPNKRAYSVWVSEIMLQQTQVATVIDYYNRWMDKWPTVQDLSRASLEEVNEMWSGLGYYSRAKRLHEGAKKVVDEMGGNMPNNAADLLKLLPGVGRYTAAAIASISFRETTGVVDGNVIRVLSRLRSIGAESSSNQAVDKFWELSNQLVDDERAGDFNQALMEFGALLCTPQSPQCSTCPLRSHCSALKQVQDHKTMASVLLSGHKDKLCAEEVSCPKMHEVDDIEECKLCLPGSSWDVSLGVCNYPRKAKKKPPKDETVAVCIIEKSREADSSFLIVQRPKTGLLAGLWEFPNIIVESNLQEKKLVSSLTDFMQNEFGIMAQVLQDPKSVGEVSHHFSHIHHKYVVHACKYVGGETSEQSVQGNRAMKWISREDLDNAALSTAMRKVFSAFENYGKAKTGQSQAKLDSSKKRKRTDAHDGRKQMVLDAFLKTKISS